MPPRGYTRNIMRENWSRRSWLGLLTAPAMRVLAQGVSTRAVKPMPRGKPSGLPFHSRFTDVAAQAGLRAPLIYGGRERKTYILERSAAGAHFSTMTTTDCSTSSC